MVRLFAFLIAFPAFAVTFEIRGRVLDNATDAPIANAKVEFIGPHGIAVRKTDRSGNFRFVLRGKHAGKIVVTASRPGVYRPTKPMSVPIENGQVPLKLWMDYEAWKIEELAEFPAEAEPSRQIASEIPIDETLAGRVLTSVNATNTHAETVGRADRLSPRESQAFLFTPDRGITNLKDYVDTDYRYQLEEARSISDNGEITGVMWKNGEDGSGKVAFRMTPICLGDLNGDRYVNGEDFFIWQRNNGKRGKLFPQDGDLNGDNRIDGSDYSMLQAAFGARYDRRCQTVRSPKLVPRLSFKTVETN